MKSCGCHKYFTIFMSLEMNIISKSPPSSQCYTKTIGYKK